MKLTAKAVEQAKPKDRSYRLSDGRGLFLYIGKGGSKGWRLRYFFGGKEKMISLGIYPEVSLKDARNKCLDARRLIDDGIDPSSARKEEKAEIQDTTETFESVAREWHTKYLQTWTEGHAKTIISRLENNVFPWIGTSPIKEVSAQDVLGLLRRIEARGAIESAHRVRGIIGQVFRYAVAAGMAPSNPAADLRGALTPVVEKHHASITDPKEIGPLLRAIDGYSGHNVTRCALQLAPLVFVRPGELRHAEWEEIDLEAAEWRIPASKMKAREQHLVPLSRQALEVLEDLQPLTGPSGYVFPSIRTKDKPMSENTVNAALRRLGYTSDEMTGHGFRSMASTILNEQGWTPDAIERQLAHAERNQVRAAYNYAEHLPERKRMMQAWADYLDDRRKDGKVIPINREQTA